MAELEVLRFILSFIFISETIICLSTSKEVGISYALLWHNTHNTQREEYSVVDIKINSPKSKHQSILHRHRYQCILACSVILFSEIIIRCFCHDICLFLTLLHRLGCIKTKCLKNRLQLILLVILRDLSLNVVIYFDNISKYSTEMSRSRS